MLRAWFFDGLDSTVLRINKLAEFRETEIYVLKQFVWILLKICIFGQASFRNYVN